jgi:hypothetical protein
MNNNPEDKGQKHEGHEDRTNIQIDRQHYKVEAEALTGAQLRALVAPPIPPERDLFLVVPGTDRKITDTETVTLEDGMRFFTAPGKINPGASC